MKLIVVFVMVEFVEYIVYLITKYLRGSDGNVTYECFFGDEVVEERMGS